MSKFIQFSLHIYMYCTDSIYLNKDIESVADFQI